MAHVPILILAQPHDGIALRVHTALLRRGRHRVRIVSDGDLLGARRWDHRIVGGRARTEIDLADGSTLVSSALGAVLNRLRTVPAQHFALWRDADVQYAVAETHALWLSWLEGIDAPVFNRATPRGLSGEERGQLEWLHLATAAGFPARGWQLTTNARRYAHPEYPAQPLVSPSRGAAEPPASTHDAAEPMDAPLGQSPAMFLEPVDKATAVVTSVGGRVIGHRPEWWTSEFFALHELTSDTLLQAVFALRKGAFRDRKTDWRLCHLSSGVDVADDEVIDALGDLLEKSAAS